jgi:hypothetical protein
MEVKDIRRKLQSIAHRECDNQLSEQDIIDFVNNGKNPAGLGRADVVDFIPTPEELLQKLPFIIKK